MHILPTDASSLASQDQFTLLTQDGVAAWNHWRQNHPEIEIDLSEADLQYLNLSSIDLREANLRGADLSGAKLDNSDFTGATTNGCLGYPQVGNTLLLDDPLLISAFAEEPQIGLTEIGIQDIPPGGES
ncbi:MAG TPA: pentapeptide repeat-containing protein [Ktedonobacteraceae bacterium]|nr:pentapeptide repeat-containing protein [Ktedonobacteraceae bacterium]